MGNSYIETFGGGIKCTLTIWMLHYRIFSWPLCGSRVHKNTGWKERETIALFFPRTWLIR